MAEGNKRREWVKNAAIIFLAVMLLLTFFSNTIMNYSLPEVSAQYVMSGTLSEQVRGTATVEAAQTYEIKATETREIASVEVKRGDAVEKDQVLMTLKEGDSAELEKAKEELEAAEFEYRKMLISAGNDYSLDELAISNLQEDIAKAKKDLADIDTFQKAYEDAQKVTKQAKDKLSAAEKKQKDLDKQIGYVNSEKTADLILLDENYYKKITTAIDEVDKCKKDKEAADKAVEKIKEDAVGKVDSAEIDSKRRALGRAEDTLNDLVESCSAAWLDGDYDTAKSLEKQIKQQEYTITDLRAEYNELITAAAKKTGYEFKLEQAIKKQTNAENKLSEKNKALDDIKAVITKNLTLKSEKAAKEAEELSAAYENAKEDEAKAKEKASLTVEEAEKKIEDQERELESKKLSLAQAQKKDLASAGTSAIDIEIKQSNIEKLKKNVEKLTKEAAGGEIRAAVAGVIESLNCVAGEKLEGGSVAAVIQMTEKGYTASINVTAEQSKKVKVGDKADVQYFWYGDAEAVLSSIKTDPASPQSRQLVFSVTGDVSPGQQLQLVLGTKGQQYETIVPNSAIREDNNGKFVLSVAVKSSPLGNRYTAKRVDVQVLASDDKSSAVSGELIQSDFIISTSTKPINPGDQVRLVDN